MRCSALALIRLPAAAQPALAANAYLEPYKVMYDAEPNETNRTTITGSSSPTENTSTHIFISDWAPITAHWPPPTARAARGSPTTGVSCVLEDDFIEVSLGDRNDSFDMQHTSAEVRTTVQGGPGDDGLQGGPASDLLFGSAGADTLRGRGGPGGLSGDG